MAVKPGYKLTEVGVIPEDWECNEIGELALRVGSGITPTGGEKIYKEYGIPFVRSQNIGWGDLLLDDLAYITDKTHESFQSSEIKQGDVLLNITGASIGRSAVADKRLNRGNVNQHVCEIRPTNNLDSYYLNNYLLSANGQKQIDSFQAGGNRQGLNYQQVRSFKVPLPPLPEQHAIATALSDVDTLITKLDQLIAKKRDIKQATMQQLLTGQTRLPGFSGEWEVKRLGEFGSTYGGLTGKTKSDFGSGNAFYITFMNIMSNVMINDSEFGMVRINQNEKQNSVLENDIFFNGSSETPEEVGLCAVLKAKLDNVYLNSFCFGYRLRINEIADGLFLAYYFRSNVGRELLKSLAQGATRYNLSKRALLMVEFQLPPFPEQQAIATILSDMDAEITALESRRKKTRALKQGMMQELLTGRIRLPIAKHNMVSDRTNPTVEMRQ